MPDGSPTQVSRPFEVYASAGAIPDPPAGDVALREITNSTTGATLASGFLVVRDAVSPPFKPWYDAVLLLHACEGEVELEYDGARHRMEQGGIAWVRSGSTVAFHARGGAATFFYAATPADWRFRVDPPFGAP